MSTVHCSNTLGTSGVTCTNTATSVILVRTWMEDDRHSTMPAYWPVFTCTDCAPEVMHELVAQGDHREDMVTAVIDTPPVDDGTDWTLTRDRPDDDWDSPINGSFQLSIRDHDGWTGEPLQPHYGVDVFTGHPVSWTEDKGDAIAQMERFIEDAQRALRGLRALAVPAGGAS